MSHKLFFAIFVCALISVATVNVCLNQQNSVSLSSLALANLDALANGEGGNSGGGENNNGDDDYAFCQECQVCTGDYHICISELDRFFC